ncbi:IDEAL domain-containing protein [Salipaludibacillus sp. CF4.18]|uniref:IDEAL domain-containing protein n=1 Tax=Salipaludibacillus sp. CF4.18 TaxID=3373081 RepID=UPI003EE7D37E
MNFKIGDKVMVWSTATAYFQRKGVVQSIDIYGQINVKIDGSEGDFIKVKRDELRFLENYQVKKHSQKSTSNKVDSDIYLRGYLNQLINLSLDTRDEDWFYKLLKKLEDIN